MSVLTIGYRSGIWLEDMLQASSGFNSIERRVVLVMGLAYMLRMLGLFIALPVLVLASERFAGATPVLVGLALGIYGLPQALLQIPFGWLSDRVGRKPVIVSGFLIFVAGSLVAAAADTMAELIAGRVIQGMGAVAAVMMALAADLTREEQRSSVLAFIGVGIGLAFMLALAVGPVIDAWFGLRGIFLVSALLGVMAIVLITVALPSPARPVAERGSARRGFVSALRNYDLLRLNASVFFLHLVLTANFFLLPSLLEKQLGIARATHWMFYAPVLLGSFLLILPLLRLAEKKRRVKEFLLVAVVLLGVSQVLAFFQEVTWLNVIGTTTLFFVAFNYLEASLPSLVSRFCEAGAKGVSMGIFSNGQFLGVFAGGVFAGGVSSFGGDGAVYLLNAGAVAAWLLLLIGMTRPRHAGNRQV